MEKGSKEIKGRAGSTIEIRSSGQFCAFGVEQRKRTLILGPINSNQRILRYKLPPDVDTIFVKAEKSVEWSVTWSYYNPSEVLDKTPVEIPIGYHEPESLADQMRRFITEEVSRAAESVDAGSFDQEDDFEDDDPMLTNYELTDMQEVEEIDWDDPPAEKPVVDLADPEPTAAKDEAAIEAAVKKAVDKEAAD